MAFSLAPISEAKWSAKNGPATSGVTGRATSNNVAQNSFCSQPLSREAIGKQR
jgi:hypothetical protein